MQRIAARIGRSLERTGLITRDIENAYLAFDPAEEASINALHRGCGGRRKDTRRRLQEFRVKRGKVQMPPVGQPQDSEAAGPDRRRHLSDSATATIDSGGNIRPLRCTIRPLVALSSAPMFRGNLQVSGVNS